MKKFNIKKALAVFLSVALVNAGTGMTSFAIGSASAIPVGIGIGVDTNLSVNSSSTDGYRIANPTDPFHDISLDTDGKYYLNYNPASGNGINHNAYNIVYSTSLEMAKVWDTFHNLLQTPAYDMLFTVTGDWTLTSTVPANVTVDETQMTTDKMLQQFKKVNTPEFMALWDNWKVAYDSASRKITISFSYASGVDGAKIRTVADDSRNGIIYMTIPTESILLSQSDFKENGTVSATDGTIEGNIHIFYGTTPLKDLTVNGSAANSITMRSYTENYSFISSSSTVLPQEVLNYLPVVENYEVTNDYVTGNAKNARWGNGSVITPVSGFPETVTTKDGIWVFKGWDASSKTISGADATFTGTWVLVPLVKDAGTIKAHKNWTGRTTHPDSAEFKLYMVSQTGDKTQIGSAKTADAGIDWTVSWTDTKQYYATPSEATISDATRSDADEVLIDGEVLNDVSTGDVAGFAVEETAIPNYTVSYADPVISGDVATYEITNYRAPAGSGSSGSSGGSSGSSSVTSITGPQVPLTPTPGTSVNPETTIDNPEIPTAGMPKTGEERSYAWLILLFGSVTLLAGTYIYLLRKKI